jgi:hypothetical protein
MLTVQGAGGVSGPIRRRVLSVRTLGDDMIHARGRGPLPLRSPASEDELEAGAPMDHPMFPVLWRAGEPLGRASQRQSLSVPEGSHPDVSAP